MQNNLYNTQGKGGKKACFCFMHVSWEESDDCCVPVVMTSRPPWKVSSSKWCSSLSAKITSTFALLKYILVMDVWKMTVERREEEVPVEEQALCTWTADRLSSIWRQRNDITECVLEKSRFKAENAVVIVWMFAQQWFIGGLNTFKEDHRGSYIMLDYFLGEI